MVHFLSYYEVNSDFKLYVQMEIDSVYCADYSRIVYPLAYLNQNLQRFFLSIFHKKRRFEKLEIFRSFSRKISGQTSLSLQ